MRYCLEVTADFISRGVGGGGGGICETAHYGIADVTVVSKAVDIINEIEDWERDKRHFPFETCRTLYCLDLIRLCGPSSLLLCVLRYATHVSCARSAV